MSISIFFLAGGSVPSCGGAEEDGALGVCSIFLGEGFDDYHSITQQDCIDIFNSTDGAIDYSWEAY